MDPWPGVSLLFLSKGSCFVKGCVLVVVLTVGNLIRVNVCVLGLH